MFNDVDTVMMTNPSSAQSEAWPLGHSPRRAYSSSLVVPVLSDPHTHT